MRALLIFSALLFGGAPVAVNAQDFQDKTIRFVVGYSPGGLFDLYTRVIARHFAKHVSGNPTVIVENMTGASGIIAANYVYNVAKPNGLTIGAWGAPLVLQHIMGNEAVRFDGRKFGYLGVPSPYDTVCTFNEKSGVANMNDWFAAKGDALKFDTAEYYELLREADRMESLINQHWTIMGQYDRQHRVKLVVDEWGAWYKKGSEVHPSVFAPGV